MFTDLILKQLPKYTIKRPSTNKPLWFRPILVKEEKKLLIAQEFATKEEIVRAVSDVLDSCFEDMNSLKLPTYEFDYLFVNLRVKSIGQNISAKFTCPDTEEKINLNLDLMSIKIEGIDKYNPSVKINDNLMLLFRPPNYTDLADINIDELTYTDLIKLTSKCILKIITPTEEFEITDVNRSHVVDMLENMTSQNFSKIIEYFNTVPAYEHVVNYTTSDGVERSIKISGIQDFFRLASVT
jgi:hypothetical protein